MRAKLRVRPPDADPFDVAIGNTATIGRSRDNTVSLHFSPHASRQHAIIRCHNAYEYQIMDLGSRNGTFVDGRRVIVPVTLRHGSLIRISTTDLYFEVTEDQPSEVAAAATLAAGTDTGLEEAVDAAIMVCDLRGFSTVSEILPEEQLARSLGDWFRKAGNLVQESGGTIDKFIGDALLAYWSRPDLNGAEAGAALHTAHSLVSLAKQSAWPPPASNPFRIAVALHHGSVTCGNIGLVAQRDATIIGDAVNTAFRLETTMKRLNEILVVSGDFLEALTATPEGYRDLGSHALKGKNQEVRLFAPPA